MLLVLCKRVTHASILHAIKNKVFFIFCLHHTNNRLEIIFFLFAPFQLSSQKELFLGRKNAGVAFWSRLTPPNFLWTSLRVFDYRTINLRL